jgi:hypothetical protein
MKELDPFDASILNVLARVPEDGKLGHLRKQLVERLDTKEGKEIARALLTPGAKKVSKDARVTAASLKRRRVAAK